MHARKVYLLVMWVALHADFTGIAASVWTIWNAPFVVIGLAVKGTLHERRSQ
jgi:hypothetical protein